MRRDSAYKILLWMNMKSHHQSGFISAMIDQGLDVKVFYYGTLSEDRKKLGWLESELIESVEYKVEPNISSINQCDDWRNRVHIVPGIGTSFLRKLIKYLIVSNAKWFHWSEAGHPGIKWYLSYPRKLWFSRMINKYSLGALAIGDMAKNDFLRWGVDLKKIYYLPYSVLPLELPEIKSENYDFLKKYKTRFLFVGQLCERKQTHVLIHAFSKMLNKFDDACLMLVGSGDEDKYKKMVHKLGVKENIYFIGSMPASQIPEVMNVCDVFVLPSKFDGWGMVLAEAASMSKALIATDRCGAASHLITHGENGYIVPANKEGALIHAMKSYCCNNELSYQHGLKSIIKYNFITPKECAKKLCEILNNTDSG